MRWEQPLRAPFPHERLLFHRRPVQCRTGPAKVVIRTDAIAKTHVTTPLTGDIARHARNVVVLAQWSAGQPLWVTRSRCAHTSGGFSTPARLRGGVPGQGGRRHRVATASAALDAVRSRETLAGGEKPPTAGQLCPRPGQSQNHGSGHQWLRHRECAVSAAGKSQNSVRKSAESRADL